MILRRAVFIAGMVFLATPLFAAADKSEETSDQQINDFSLAGYGDRGKKAWDLSGKTADIFDNNIKLNDITGNLYGKEEDIKLTADKGDFNKANGKVYLEDNVVITTSSGAKLTTDTLNWDRPKQLVTTEDKVNIEKDNMVTTATGARGEPNLNNVTLEKDVTVKINPDTAKINKAGDLNKDKIVITCDGPLNIDYQKNVATFYNNVKVEKDIMEIYSDKMDIYFIPGTNNQPAEQAPSVMGSKINKIVCRGNVKIVQGQNISYSEEATYSNIDKKIVLVGRPKLVIYSAEELSASLGN